VKTTVFLLAFFVFHFPLPAQSGSGDMALIPSGWFLMGSEDGGVDERPIHRVRVDSFYMNRDLVTNADYARFLNAFGNRVEEGKKWLDLDGPLSSWLCKIRKRDGRFEPKPGYENHPVVKVSWYGAAAYARWLGKRLPTEAEWERAARGLLQGKRFVFGDTLSPDQANILGLHASAPVGSYPPNSFGLCDLTATVWQWCSDWYDPDYYARSPSQNPKGPEIGAQKVLRGGSWFHKDSWRVAARGADEPTSRHFCFVTGFRCAKDPR
jgi:formylglycine-generating enzyme required for sulfatase activity